MADKFIQLPTDIANTGKKVRTNERDVGPDTVEEHFNILQDRFSDVQGSLLTSHPSGSEPGLVVRVAFSGSNPGVATVTGSVGLSSPVAVSNFPSSFNVGNFPSTQTVTGTVGISSAIAVSNFPGSTSVSNFPATQAVTGSVGISGPITGAVGITAPVTVSNFPGSFSVSNFPATQIVTGSVGLSGPITGTVALASAVAVSNFPASQTVAGTVTATQGAAASIAAPWPVVHVSGGVYVGTVANPFVMTGSVGLSGPVTGAVGITGPVAVSNFPSSFSVSNFPATQAVTGSVALSGPITGTVAIASSVAINNFPSSFQVSNFPATQTVTGSVGLSGPVTGTVAIASSVAINNFPSNQQVNGSVTANQGTANATPWAITGSVMILSGGLGAQVLNSAPGSDTGQSALAVRVISSVGGGSTVTAQSGSVVGLLQGGQAVSMANPIPITGSVFVINPGGAGSNVTAQSGSVTGLLVGGVALSSGNPVPITGTLTLAAAPTVNQGTSPWVITGSIGLIAPVTGNIGITGPVAVSNFPGSFSVSNFPSTQNVVDQSGSIVGLLVGGVPVSSGNPVPITGALTLAAAPQIASGSVTGMLVGGVAVSNANRVPVTGSVEVVINPALGGGGNVASPLFVTGSVGVLVQGTQASAANPVPIAGPTLTKGTQGATGLSVQQLKDAGRAMKTYTALNFTAAGTEALVTLVPVTDGAVGVATGSFTVTAGKKFRVVSMTVSTRNAGAAVQGVVCTLRVSATGNLTAGSPPVAVVAAGSAAAVANNVGYGETLLDMDLAAGWGFGVTQVGTANAGNYVSLVGYEY